MSQNNKKPREHIPFIEDACGADETLLMTSRLHWIFLIKGLGFLVFLIWVGMKIDAFLESYMYTLAERQLQSWSYMFFKLGNFIETAFIFAGIAICAVYFSAYFTVTIGLTTKRLMMRKGLLFVKLINVDLEEIKSAYVDHGFFGRFLNYGEIRMDARFVENFYVPNIASPYRLLRAMNEARAIAGDTVIAGEIPLQPTESGVSPAPSAEEVAEEVMVTPAAAQVVAAPTAPVAPAAPVAPTAVPATPAVITVRAGDLPPDMPIAVPEAHAPVAPPVAAPLPAQQPAPANPVVQPAKKTQIEPDIAPEPLSAAMDGLQSAIETFTDLAKPPEDRKST